MSRVKFNLWNILEMVVWTAQDTRELLRRERELERQQPQVEREHVQARRQQVERWQSGVLSRNY